MDRLPRLFLCALVAGLLAGCGGKPRDPVVDLQTFFQQVAAGQADVAYQATAFGFQSQRNAESFSKAAQELGLVGASNVTWEAPEMDGRTAKFRVNLKNRSGQDVPLIVTLLDENGAWRIYSMRSPPNEKTGLSDNRFSLVGKLPSLTSIAQQPVPPMPEIITLLRDSLMRFNDAIATKSFDTFYDSVHDRIVYWCHWERSKDPGHGPASLIAEGDEIQIYRLR